MYCVYCSSELLVEHRSGVEIDGCPGCNAQFFDAGELVRSSNTRSSLEESLQALAASSSRRSGRCPRCSEGMVEVSSGLIAARVCTSCSGVMLPVDSQVMVPERPTSRAPSLERVVDVADGASDVAELANDGVPEGAASVLEDLVSLVSGLFD